MRSTLSIVGAGGHGRVIADSAAEMACWETIQFFDDSATGKLLNTDWEIVGSLESALINAVPVNQSIVVGVGNNTIRLDIQNKLEKAGWPIATIIHPSASISRGATIGPGTVVMANAAVNIGASIGKACIINTCSSIDHDCLLESGVHVSPGAALAGGVTLETCCWVGVGATLIQGTRVAENSIVGAGAVVIRDVPPNVTSVGNPAKTVVST